MSHLPTLFFSRNTLHRMQGGSKLLLCALLMSAGSLCVLLALTISLFYMAPYKTEWVILSPMISATIVMLWLSATLYFFVQNRTATTRPIARYARILYYVSAWIPVTIVSVVMFFALLHLIVPPVAIALDRVFSAVIANRIYTFDVRTGWLSNRLGLPTFDSKRLEMQSLTIPSRIYDADGVEIGCFAREQRIYTALTPELEASNFVQAILASEDAGFYQHRGFDLYAIVRAAVSNAIGGRIESGASTLTMQLVKNLYLTKERSYTRKIREVVLAAYVEHAFTKREILAQYVNFVYFGGSYGVEAAAQSYFAKRAASLTPAEAAFLAGLINYPNLFQTHGDRGELRANQRKNRVLALMEDRGMITSDELASAYREKLTPARYVRACIDTEPFIRQEVNRQLGVQNGLHLAKGGFTIRTSIKRNHQQALTDACTATLTQYLGRHPERADTIRCAALSVTIADGSVVALVPGQNHARDGWSGVTLSKRQAGSSFKPILYAAYFEKRLRTILEERQRFCDTAIDREVCIAQYQAPIDLLEGCTALDAPVAVPNVVGWKNQIITRHIVRNYPYESRPRHRGTISCELALAESRNAAAMWTLGQLGGTGDGELAHWRASEDVLVTTAERLGIVSALRHRNITGKTEEDRQKELPNYTLAIGSAEVTLWEMANANLPFLTGGIARQVSLIDTVHDVHGTATQTASHAPERVLEPEVAWAMQRLLAGVVDDPLGTAHVLRNKGNFPKGALCGKTGTATNADASSTDNWFIGCTTEYLVLVRINNVTKTTLGKKETGGRNALPVFAHYAKTLNLVSPASVFVAPAMNTRTPQNIAVDNVK